MAELVEGVGGVGDELAQEDLRMRVEGVDDELQQLTDFGLEFAFRHRFIMTKWERKTKGDSGVRGLGYFSLSFVALRAKYGVLRYAQNDNVRASRADAECRSGVCCFCLEFFRGVVGDEGVDGGLEHAFHDHV